MTASAFARRVQRPFASGGREPARDALPRPDVDAALRLIDATGSIYGFDVDETEFRKLGERLRAFDEQSTDRTTTLSEAENLGSHAYPEDRM